MIPSQYLLFQGHEVVVFIVRELTNWWCRCSDARTHKRLGESTFLPWWLTCPMWPVAFFLHALILLHWYASNATADAGRGWSPSQSRKHLQYREPDSDSVMFYKNHSGEVGHELFNQSLCIMNWYRLLHLRFMDHSPTPK